MSLLRKVASRFVPRPLRKTIVSIFGLDRDARAVFARVYAEGAWGQGPDGFYSGEGSHDPRIVEPYVAAARGFLRELPRPVHLVDIGCGDFNVGQRLADAVDSYIACDVVPALIERNRAKYAGTPNLRFEVVNAVDDPLPGGTVVTIRQVLQHLSNDQIIKVAEKLAIYKEWIVTEHLPATADFLPNAEKRPGRDIRPDSGSGIVLTRPPFNVVPRSEKVLLEVAQLGGVIRTTAYSF